MWEMIKEVTFDVFMTIVTLILFAGVAFVFYCIYETLSW